MLLAPRTRARRAAPISTYEADGTSVLSAAVSVLRPDRVALGLGVGRVAIGAAFLLAPATAARLLGLDSGTAKRVTHLARMAAVRDLGLGAGTLAAPGATVVPWLVAGAAADAVDALAIAAALRTGAARGVVAVGVVVGGATSAAAGFWAASRLRSR